MLPAEIANMPKVELHLHLDCSLSYEVVKRIRPDITFDDYRHDFIAPEHCTDLADYIARASSAIEIMQTREQLRLVTLDLIDQLKKDQVIYAEIRYAPLQHTNRGLFAQEVVKIVSDAAYQGSKDSGIKIGIILCTLRHFTQQESMSTVKLVEQFSGSNVVGFDIAGDEAGYPVEAHIKAFAYALDKGIPCTAHAGEASGPQSVWETLHHFHPSRIGHGVRSIEDPRLIEYLKRNKIHLEICPSSNIHTNIYQSIEEHPVNRFYKEEVSFSINTDGRSLSNTSLFEEYRKIYEIFGWELEQYYRCNREAISHAFCSELEKSTLQNIIRQAINKLNP